MKNKKKRSNLREVKSKSIQKFSQKIINESTPGKFKRFMNWININYLIISGLIGILIAIFLSLTKITGFATYESTKFNMFNINIILVLVSILSLYLGVKKKRA